MGKSDGPEIVTSCLAESKQNFLGTTSASDFDDYNQDTTPSLH